MQISPRILTPLRCASSHFVNGVHCVAIVDATNTVLASSIEQATARAIVRAVNLYDRLTYALRLTRAVLNALGGSTAKERKDATADADRVLAEAAK